MNPEEIGQGALPVTYVLDKKVEAIQATRKENKSVFIRIRILGCDIGRSPG